MADYYVKNGGNNSLSGLSDAAAWATLSRVESHSFSAGDNIFFKCGDTFRGSCEFAGLNGNSSNYIRFSSYGVGVKPKLYQSTALNDASDWANTAGNVWENVTSISGGVNNDIGNIIFDDGDSYGWKMTSVDDVDAQGDFFWDTSTDTVYLYSTSNPGTYYDTIEIAGTYDSYATLFFTNSSYIQIDNIDFRYVGGAVIWMQNCSHFLIEKNDMSWIGGWYTDTGFYRLGGAIAMWVWGSNGQTYCTDITIRKNIISECYDTGISPQGWGGLFQNIYIYDNIIFNCYYSFEFFIRDEPGHAGAANNIRFEHNTCYGAGYQWSEDQRPDTGNETHVCMRQDENDSVCTNIIVRNNIFDTAVSAAWKYEKASFSAMTFDYNLYHCDSIEQSTASLASWQSLSGQEANSISDDPLLTSIDDFHITVGSPAIHQGLYVSYIDDDYDDVVFSNPPAIGAFEYTGVAGTRTLRGRTTITFAATLGEYILSSQCVPNTDDFTLEHVLAVVEPSGDCLQDAFDEADSDYFDPAYEGERTCLSNFRNYCVHNTYDHIYSGDSADACVITFSTSVTGTVYNNRMYGVASIVFDTVATGTMTSEQYLYGTSSITFSQTGTLTEKTGGFTSIHGALYNKYAVDSGKLTISGWTIPSYDESLELFYYLEGLGDGSNAKPLKDTIDWTEGYEGTNISNFSAKGSGMRDTDGSFTNLYEQFSIWLLDDNYAFFISLLDTLGWGASEDYIKGYSVRTVRPATEDELLLDDGTFCDNYIGTDLRTYKTVKIYYLIWLAENLCESKYNDNTDITVVSDNATWAALTSEAMCWYNNDSSNGYEETELPQKRTSTGSSSITFTTIADLTMSNYPDNLSAVQDAPATHLINVSWDAVTGATGYILQRKPRYMGGWVDWYVSIYIGADTSYADLLEDNDGNPLPNATDVTYRVCAYTESVAGAYSPEETVIFYL